MSSNASGRKAFTLAGNPMSPDADDDWQNAIRPSTTAFFLDVDGTLLGFKERPEEVRADPDLLSLLGRLVVVSGGAVGLVSGRMVDDLDRIMAPLLLPAGGVHGADLRFPDGQRETFEGTSLDQVRQAAADFVVAHPGLRLEQKGGTTFAIHFRAAPELADAVAQFLQHAVSGHDLVVQHGKMVAEVKPEGCNKGRAIEALLRHRPFAGRRPLFIGDDLTDEYGFAAVNAADGISVKVGGAREKTIAHHRLADVFAVRKLLEDICRSDQGII